MENWSCYVSVLKAASYYPNDRVRLWSCIIGLLITLGTQSLGSAPLYLRVKSSEELGTAKFNVEWNSSVQTRYVVEVASNLSNGGEWQFLQDTVGSGGLCQIEVALQTNGLRFYRVRTDSTLDSVAEAGINLMQALMYVLPSDGGILPRNEASRTELDSRSVSANFFVPAQLGFWLCNTILSNAYRKENPFFSKGLNDTELVAVLNQAATALEMILRDYAFVDNVSGAKALYQVHESSTGRAPRQSDFEQKVSLLDNAYLIVGLEVARLGTTTIDPLLSERFRRISGTFNLRLWLDQDGRMLLGAAEWPASGGAIDRITSESRLAIVAALARGDLTIPEFDSIIRNTLMESKAKRMGNVFIQHVSYFGTALEVWVPTIFFAGERETVLGGGTLFPVFDAWEANRPQMQLAATGAMGISDGFGRFRGFGLSPAEGVNSLLDKSIIVLPAAGLVAGVLGTPGAMQNLERAAAVAREARVFHPIYGIPNYADPLATGLVNSSNPVWGFLEVGQMTLAVLNRSLGGRFLENLLRSDPAWAGALSHYYECLHAATFSEAENIALPSFGRRISRQNASGKEVWHLSDGQSASYQCFISEPGIYWIRVRYSNDDLGVNDEIVVEIDGKEIASFRTVDTGDGSAGWEKFVATSALSAGTLTRGFHQITLFLSHGDGFGVDLDLWELSR